MPNIKDKGLSLTSSNAETLMLRKYGAPVLRKRSETVESITDEIQEFAGRMVDTMLQDEGIGLAAPQVGASIRLVTVSIPMQSVGDSPGERLLLPQMPLVLINPVLTKFSEETEVAEEGCLSIPGIYGPVRRSSTVVLYSSLLNGETVHLPCGGLLARCLQHEVDHLDGTLFVDRLKKGDRKSLKDDLRALEQKTMAELKNQPK